MGEDGASGRFTMDGEGKRILLNGHTKAQNSVVVIDAAVSVKKLEETLTIITANGRLLQAYVHLNSVTQLVYNAATSIERTHFVSSSYEKEKNLVSSGLIGALPSSLKLDCVAKKLWE